MSTAVHIRIINFIRPRLNRRSVAFLLCLILSGVFWLLTSLSKNYVDELTVPVVYTGVPPDLLISNNPPSTVRAQVKGFGFDLLWYKIQLSDMLISIQADPALLPRVKKDGVYLHYILTTESGRASMHLNKDELDVKAISPDTLFLRFVPRSSKKVPVRLQADITYQKQFGMISEPVIIPDSVLLNGPKEAIDTVTQVLTQPQKWQNLNESTTAEVSLVPFSDNPNIVMGKEKVRVELNVVQFTEGSVMVQLQVVDPKKLSMKIFPHQVELKYLAPLSVYDNITSDQFEATVELNETTLLNPTLRVLVTRQPTEVVQVRVNPPQVEYIIQK